MKKVNWSPVGPKKEVAAAIDKFVKGDRIISNFGTQKEPEYYSGTVIMVSPKRVAVKVHYDDGEIHMEPVDGTGLGVIGFMKGKTKYKRAIPTERVLALIDQERWHVPAIKKLIKGQPTVENKVTPDIKRKHEIVEKIDNTLKNKNKEKKQGAVSKEQFDQQMQNIFDMVINALGVPVPNKADYYHISDKGAISYINNFNTVKELDKVVNLQSANKLLTGFGFKLEVVPPTANREYKYLNRTVYAYSGNGIACQVSTARNIRSPEVSVTVYESGSTAKGDVIPSVKPSAAKTKTFEQVNAVKGVSRNPIKAKILDLVGFRKNGVKDGPICVSEVEDMDETGFIVERFGSVPFEWYVGYVPFSKTQGTIGTMSNTLTDQQFLDLVEKYK